MAENCSNNNNVNKDPAKEDVENNLPLLLSKLREMLKDDKQIKRKDDVFLTKFVRVKNYDLERAVVSVRNYYKHIENNAELTKDIKPSHLTSFYEDNIVVILKNPCKFNRKVALVQPGNWDTNKHSSMKLLQASVFILEQFISDADTQLNGFSLIYDFKNFSISHILSVTRKDIKTLVSTGRDGFPLKIHAVHLINYPSIFWGLFYIASKFMSQKQRQRLRFHKSLESLYEIFDTEILPKSLGGHLELEEAMDHEIIQKLLKDDKAMEDYFS